MELEEHTHRRFGLKAVIHENGRILTQNLKLGSGPLQYAVLKRIAGQASSG